MLSETALRELDAYRDEVPQLRKDLAAANERAEKAERERDEAVAALDANWVTHQRVARAESDNARLRERVDELEGVFSKLSGGVDMKGRSPVVMPVKDFLAQMDAPKGGEA